MSQTVTNRGVQCPQIGKRELSGNIERQQLI